MFKFYDRFGEAHHINVIIIKEFTMLNLSRTHANNKFIIINALTKEHIAVKMLSFNPYEMQIGIEEWGHMEQGINRTVKNRYKVTMGVGNHISLFSDVKSTMGMYGVSEWPHISNPEKKGTSCKFGFECAKNITVLRYEIWRKNKIVPDRLLKDEIAIINECVISQGRG